jgi:hypothetical protein
MNLHTYLTPTLAEALARISPRNKKSATIRRLIRGWDPKTPLPKPEQSSKPMHLELSDEDYAHLIRITEVSGVSISQAIGLLIEQATNTVP